MALRATSGPTPSTKSLGVGETLTVSAKVENTGGAPEQVSLFALDLHEGALRRPVAFVFTFEPTGVEVPPKSRKSMAFTWRAELPEGKDAFTFRGKLVLRQTLTGQLVGEAPLDLYVRR